MKHNIHPKGYYSSKELCPKCKSAGRGHNFVKGFSNWISSQHYDSDLDAMEFCCTNCYFSWFESLIDSSENQKQDNSPEPINKTDNLNPAPLIERLENKVKTQEKEISSLKGLVLEMQSQIVEYNKLVETKIDELVKSMQMLTEGVDVKIAEYIKSYKDKQGYF